MTAAACLAQRGHQVTVFEQHHRPGGVTAPFERGEYRWDLGQLLLEGLGPDEPVGLIIADLGVADQVQVMVEERGYVFPEFGMKKQEVYEGAHWRLDAASVGV